MYAHMRSPGGWELGRRVLAPGGRFVTIVGDGDPQAPVTMGACVSRCISSPCGDALFAGVLLGIGLSVVGRSVASWFGAPAYSMVASEPKASELAEMRAAVEAGHIRPVIDKRFDFSVAGTVLRCARTRSGTPPDIGR
jgi:hypothetical protein